MALHIQNQIRNNAEEVNGYFQDMIKWEQDIKKKDKKIIQKKSLRQQVRTAPGARKGAGTVAVNTTVCSDKTRSAASHTYDVGYKKWEKLQISEDDEVIDTPIEKSSEESQEKPFVSTELTPASLVPLSEKEAVPQSEVPKARGRASNVEIETFERERGNEEFKSGNFSNAIKCYTKCLGLKPGNYIAFSNRAMAYLKLKEHHKAEIDCNCALRIAPTHVKSLLRRATARSHLGKYRAAISDLHIAIEVDPTNKQVQQELKKVKDLLKVATTKAPSETVTTVTEAEYLAILNNDSEALESNTLANKNEESTAESRHEISLVSGPELPWPSHQHSSEKCSSLIDMDKIARDVEDGIDSISTDSKEFQSPGKSVVEFDEDNDGEWVVLSSPEKRRLHSSMNDAPKEDYNIHLVKLESSEGECGEDDQGLVEVLEQEKAESAKPQPATKKSSKNKTKKSSSSSRRIKTKSSSTQSSAAMYSVEKSLQCYKGSDKMLLKYLNSIDEKKFFSPAGTKGVGTVQNLEVDVVFDLLSGVSRCFGEAESQWLRVLDWFEGVANRSGKSSFAFVTSLLSAHQRECLSKILNKVSEECGDGTHCRVESIRTMYAL